MALAKITLKLGRKTIELTNEQFEELKQDMRDLDRQHHYYWHHSPWYSPWYYNQPMTSIPLVMSSAGVNVSVGSSNNAANVANQMLASDASKPPAFEGSIVSTA